MDASTAWTARRTEAVAHEAASLIDRLEHEQAIARITSESGAQTPISVSVLHARALLGLERNGAAEQMLGPLLSRPEATPLERALVRQWLGRALLRQWADVDIVVDYLREAAGIAARLDTPQARDIVLFARGDAAEAFARKQARKTAERELASAKELVGEDPRFTAFEASMLLSFDDRPGARQKYLSLPTEGPGSRFRHLGLAHLAHLEGAFAEAHDHLNSLGAWSASDLAPRHRRTRLYVSEHRWNEAVDACDDLLRASPLADSARWTRSERAAALWQASRRADAVAAYEQIASEPVEDRYASLARRLLKHLRDPSKHAAKRHRLASFPSVTQLRDHCGPASCELYLRYFGVEADQVEIARRIKLPNGGTPIYAMRTFLEGAGFVVRRVEATLDVMRKVLDLGIPLILEEEYSTSRHVAVAIGYDDEREVLEVQDPMTHDIRETPYESLPKLLAMANNGALIALPKTDAARLAALDAEGVQEAEYIHLVDDAWRLYADKNLDGAEALVEKSLLLRRDYEFAWICKHHITRDRRAAHQGEGAEVHVAALERILEQILALWPDDEWPEQFVGYTRFDQGRYDEAMRAFEKARDRDNADGNNWAMIADCLICMNRAQDAVRPLYEALRRMPWHVRATENLADLLERRGDLGRARVLNDVAVDISPHNPFNHEVGARVRERLGDRQGALAAFTKAAEVDPNRGYARFQRARLVAELGRRDEAWGLFEAELTARPNDGRFRIDVADVLYKNGDPERAATICDELLAKDDKLASAHAIHGAAIAKLGHLDEGLASMRKALTLRPAYAWVYAEMGQFLLQAKRLPEAIEALAAANGHNPIPMNRFELASALAEAGSGADAVWHARESLRSGGLSEARLVRAADIIARQNGVRAAMDELTESIKQLRGDPTPLRAMVTLLLELGYYPRAAIEHLDRLVELDPDDAWAQMRRGQLAMGAGPEREAEGERLLRAAIERLPNARAPRIALAHELRERSRYEGALALLEKAGAIFAVQKERLQTLLGMGRNAEARDIVAKHEVSGAPQSAAWELGFIVAEHERNWPLALELSEKLSREAGESEDDGKLGYWECEKFRSLVHLGEHARAVAFAHKQIASAEDAGYLANTALAAESQSVAAELAERGLALDPNDSRSLIARARLRELAGDLPETESILRRVMTIDPEDHRAPENLARLLAARGEVAQASELAERAVRQSVLCMHAATVRAQVRALLGDKAAALAELERAWALADLPSRQEPEVAWSLLAAARGDAALARTQFGAWAGSTAKHSIVDESLAKQTLAKLRVEL